MRCRSSVLDFLIQFSALASVAAGSTDFAGRSSRALRSEAIVPNAQASVEPGVPGQVKETVVGNAEPGTTELLDASASSLSQVGLVDLKQPWGKRYIPLNHQQHGGIISQGKDSSVSSTNVFDINIGRKKPETGPKVQQAPMWPGNAFPGELQEQQACVAWALGGECSNNPSYMLLYCATSCARMSDVAARVERFDRRGTEPFEPFEPLEPFEPFEFFQNGNFP